MNTRKVKPFTLIELLATMAIMAILASILFPALNNAREKARESTCMNIQKQTFIAVFMYSEDFNGYLVPHYTGTDTWKGLLSGKQYRYVTVIDPGYGTKYWSCPSAARESWALNSLGVNAVAGGVGYKNMFHVNALEKLITLPSPQNVKGMTDSTHNTIDEIMNNGYDSDPFRHFNGANFMFCDGHVQHLKNIEREYLPAGSRGRWTSRTND